MENADIWQPIAVLPNLRLPRAIEGEIIAVAPRHDERVETLCSHQPDLDAFLSRFTNAFGVSLDPPLLIARDSVVDRLSERQGFQAFRDLMITSVVPLSRALGLVYPNFDTIGYANSFWIYPWSLAKDGKYLVGSTPAITGLHVVEQFRGQSSPEIPEKTCDIRYLDKPLFDALLSKWKEHFLGDNGRQHLALFRSLNMATNASQIPAGIDVRFWDFGRNIALWVSAFEILAPADQKAFEKVYNLLERNIYSDPELASHKYDAYGVKPQLKSLPCWLYGKLYKARNDFIHGNPVDYKSLKPDGIQVDLYWLAAPLFRLALTAYLHLSSRPDANEFLDHQEIIERGLLRAIER